MRVFILLLLFVGSPANAQNLSLSFDDGLNPERQPMAETWNRQILAHLTQTQIKAIFFVTGKNVDNPQGMKLVTHWSEQGHTLANHTYSHHSVNSEKLSLDDYLNDINKNHQLLKDLPGWVNRFRFPYLKEGKTRSRRDGIRQWLSDNQYKPGPVSIDASDWYYNQQYLRLKKRGNTARLDKLRILYLEHLWDRAQYYDDLSKKVLNRSIEHVLLLHVNAINAAYLSDVVKMFHNKGWQFISPVKAFADPVYRQSIDILPAGESILWQLAKLKGIKNLRYPAEDSRYEKAKIDKLMAHKIPKL